MKGEIYDKKEIYDQLNKDVYFKDGGSMNLASLAGSIEKIRSKSKSSSSSGSLNSVNRYEVSSVAEMASLDLKEGDIVVIPEKREDITDRTDVVNTIKVDAPKNLIITKTAATSTRPDSGVRLVNADSQEAQLSMEPIDDYAVGDTVSAVIPVGYYYMAFDDGTEGTFSAVFVEPRAVYTYSNGEPVIYNANVCHRFETEYVREDYEDVTIKGSKAIVNLGTFYPDLSGAQTRKPGDIIDVPSKEEDITNVIFRNDGTESIHTQVYYASQDSDNFVPGTSYRCIKYERIADFPSDTNTQMSWLVFYKNWNHNTSVPANPSFLFGADLGEIETGVTGLVPNVAFFEDDFRESVNLDPDSDYIGFVEDDSSSDFYCVEVVTDTASEASTPAFIPKRQDDGVVSILDYYKFYYVAEGKTYVMSRDYNYARPLDITKNVVEELREKVRDLEDKVPTNILMATYGEVTSGAVHGEYIASDISASELASMFNIREIDNIGTISVKAVDKLFWGNVTNLFISIAEGVEQAAFETRINLSRDLSGNINQIVVRIGDKDQIEGGYGALRLIYDGSSYSVMLEEGNDQ